MNINLYFVIIFHENVHICRWIRVDTLIQFCPFFRNDAVQIGTKFVNESIYDVITDMAPNFDYVMLSCRWHYQFESCSKHFVPLLTEDGLCFAFNALNSHEVYTKEFVISKFFGENRGIIRFLFFRMAPGMMTVNSNPSVKYWSLENGYEHTSFKNTYPIRVFNAKESAALLSFIRLNKTDLEYLCRSFVPGFRIYLQTPGKCSQTMIQLPSNTVTFLT